MFVTVLKISQLEQFSLEEHCACVTPHRGVLSLPWALSSAWILKALRREQGQLQFPHLRSSLEKEIVLPNSSLTSFPCLGFLRFSLNCVIFTDTTFKSI